VALAFCLLLAGGICFIGAFDSLAHYERHHQEAEDVRRYPGSAPYGWTPERIIAVDLALAGRDLRLNIACTAIGLLLIGLGLRNSSNPLGVG